jgi:hypothetical protein
VKRILDILGKVKILQRYPVAAAAGAAVVAMFLGWRLYHGLVGQPTTPPVASRPVAPRPVTPASTTPGRGPGQGGTVTPKAPPGEQAQGTQGAPAAKAGDQLQGAGRPDPFVPLLGAGGGGGPQAQLPPVPSLSPVGIQMPGGVPGAVGALRLVGLLGDGGALAIVVDERGSYIVGPGDEIGPDVQVVRINMGRETVELRRHGVREELTLPVLMRQEGGGK